jgi:hypothetical protein
MTKSQWESLRQFDDTWRTVANLERRGAKKTDLPALLEGGFIVGRSCGAWSYQIAERGLESLKTEFPAEKSS